MVAIGRQRGLAAVFTRNCLLLFDLEEDEADEGSHEESVAEEEQEE
jgi:hypothetical protein